MDSAGRLAAIDGLRAVAVLAVIAFHYGPGFVPQGFVGVDVFFAISGYVIALSLSRADFSSWQHFLTGFYKRRVVRLLPALVVCVLLVGLFSRLFIPDSWLGSNYKKTGLLAFVGLSNFALLADVDGYFDIRTQFNPFLHTWSLAVEEQFYLFFPLLFGLWLRGRARSAGRAWVGVVPVAATGFLSLLWSAYETGVNPQQAFYMLPARYWELAAGAVLFQCHFHGHCLPRSVPGLWLASFFGVLLLVLSLIAAEDAAFPFPWALAPVVGTLLLISAARSPHASRAWVVRALQWPLLVGVGRASYSLYLWHWPVLVLMRWTVGAETPEQLLFALLLSFALGVASWYWLERPFLHSPRLRAMPPVVLLPRAAAVVFGSALLFVAMVKAPLHLGVTARESEWYPEAMDMQARVGATPVEKNATLWVIGDSHAKAYAGMVRAAARQLGLRVRIRSIAGCPIADLKRPYPDASYCRDRLDELFSELAAARRAGDIVFLASLRGERLSDQWGMYEPALLQRIVHQDRSREHQRALEQARAVIRRLLEMGFVVIIDAPKPVFRAPLFRCSDWFNRMNPVCTPGFAVPAAELRALDAPVHDALARLQAEFPTLVVWDPFPLLCPGAICRARDDAGPLFFDQDHLSGYGNRVLLPDFTRLLSEQLSSSRENR